jgi:hypothetical protein
MTSMAIGAKRYFQLSFLGPILVPLMLLPFRSTDSYLGFLAHLMTISLLFGGIPYVLTLGVLYFICRGRNDHQIQVITFITPLLFIVILTCCYLILAIFRNSTENTKITISSMPIFWFFSLIIGYGYVLVVNIIYFLLKSLGVIRTDNRPPVV